MKKYYDIYDEKPYKGFFANDGLTDPWDDHDD